jgi:hypothetical protein
MNLAANDSHFAMYAFMRIMPANGGVVGYYDGAVRILPAQTTAASTLSAVAHVAYALRVWVPWWPGFVWGCYYRYREGRESGEHPDTLSCAALQLAKPCPIQAALRVQLAQQRLDMLGL